MIFESKNDTLVMGNLRITRLSDGHVNWETPMVVSNGPQAEADEVIDRLEAGKERHHCFRVTCLLIQTPERNILVDTGWGRWPFAMRYPDSEPVKAHLARLGLTEDDIDTVITSHAHPDHIGGNVSEETGLPRYRKARYHLHQADWDHYTTEEWLGKSQYHARNLPPLKEQGVLELFDSEGDVIPGIRLLPTPGHSPGHTAIVITAGNEMAYYLGDVAHHPVHLEHPEWNAVFDVLPEMARETRGWLYDRIVREQPWIIGCHFLSPGIGKLERVDGQYRWNELKGDYP